MVLASSLFKCMYVFAFKVEWIEFWLSLIDGSTFSSVKCIDLVSWMHIHTTLRSRLKMLLTDAPAQEAEG